MDNQAAATTLIWVVIGRCRYQPRLLARSRYRRTRVCRWADLTRVTLAPDHRVRSKALVR